MDVRLSKEQQALGESAARVVDQLAPHTVGVIGDGKRKGKLEAAVASSGWRELRTATENGHPLASGVEAGIVAEELGRGLADVPFLGPTMAAELRRLAGAPPSELAETVAFEADLSSLARPENGQVSSAVAVDGEGRIRALIGGVAPSLAPLRLSDRVAQTLAAAKISGHICGWTVTGSDGKPMKAAPGPALAHEKVRYVGDEVAVVIADTYVQAKDAGEKIVVDYGVLPAVIDPKAAAKPGAPQIHEIAPNNTVYNWQLGDKAATDAAFAAAAHVTKIDIVNNRVIPVAIEPRAAVGEYDSGSDSFTLYTTSQNPHAARLVLAAFAGIAPENKLRVIAPDVGGGFGSKIYIYAEETVCVWAAKKVGRPVKWTAERSESFLVDAHGRDHVTHAELALDASGKITGLRAHTIANLGAYPSLFWSCVPTYLYALLLSGQYNIPQIYCAVDAVYTNTAPVDAVRGAGRPEATFVVERLVELAARETGRDPVAFRRANFVKSFPHQTPVIVCYDAGDYGASLDKALELADYKGFAKRKRDAARNGKLRGIGFSTYIEACGLAPSAAVGSLGSAVGLWESAEVRVNPTGSVEVLSGSHSHGQGHETTFAQVVSAFRSKAFRLCTAIPTRCSLAWAPTAHARARSACRRS